jgi:hypothetical protein
VEPEPRITKSKRVSPGMMFSTFCFFPFLAIPRAS